MGMSCGGLQAISVAADPRLRTVVICNSGVLPQPSPLAGMPALSKQALDKFHTPEAIRTEPKNVPVNALGRGFGKGPMPRQASRRGSTPRAATKHIRPCGPGVRCDGGQHGEGSQRG